MLRSSGLLPRVVDTDHHQQQCIDGEFGKMEYCIEMKEACGITAAYMYKLNIKRYEHKNNTRLHLRPGGE